MLKVPEIKVGVLVYNDQGEILLVTSHKWQDKWMVPGGGVEWGESLEETVRREIKEETTLDITDIHLLGVQESVLSPEFFKPAHIIFLDYCAKLVGGNLQLNQELQQYQWIMPEAAYALDLKPSIRLFIKNFQRFIAHNCGQDLFSM